MRTMKVGGDEGDAESWSVAAAIALRSQYPHYLDHLHRKAQPDEERWLLVT